MDGTDPTTHCGVTKVTGPCWPTWGGIEGSGYTRWPTVRFERWRNISAVRLPPLRATERPEFMTRYHADPILKIQRGTSDIRVSLNVTISVFHCSFAAFIRVYFLTFWPYYTVLSCIGTHGFVFHLQFSFVFVLLPPPVWVNGLTLSWLFEIDHCSDGEKGKDIKIKARLRDQGIKVDVNLTFCIFFNNLLMMSLF